MAYKTRIKIMPQLKNFIIEKATEGQSSFEIARQIKEQLNTDIATSTIRAMRLKYRKEINGAIGKMLETVYATQPLASLEKRLEEYERNIEMERAKVTKDGRYVGDGHVVNDALRFAGQDIVKLEQLRLRIKEYDLKKGLADPSNDIDNVIAMIEQRIQHDNEHRKTTREKL